MLFCLALMLVMMEIKGYEGKFISNNAKVYLDVQIDKKFEGREI